MRGHSWFFNFAWIHVWQIFIVNTKHAVNILSVWFVFFWKDLSMWVPMEMLFSVMLVKLSDMKTVKLLSSCYLDTV